MFFEGLIQMQLPFILISSGVSSGLYLLFLFFNIGQNVEQPSPNIDKETFSIEISKDYPAISRENTIYYHNYLLVSAGQIEFTEPIQIDEKRPLKFRSFKFAYSFQFAESSFCRPPPSC